MGALSNLSKLKSAQLDEGGAPPTPPPVAAEGEVTAAAETPSTAATRAPEKNSGSFEGDLKAFEGIPLPPPPEAQPKVVDSRADLGSAAASLSEKLKQRLEDGETVTTPLTGTEPDASTAVALPEGAEVSADPLMDSFPASAEPSADGVVQEVVYNRNNAEAVIHQLLNGANLPAVEVARMTQDWFNAIGEEIRPRAAKISMQQKRLIEQDQVIREREGAAQAGGGGVLTSLLGRLLASDPRSRHNRAIQKLRGDTEKLLNRRNQIAEQFRDRIYDVKARQIPERMLEIQASAQALSRAIRLYNESFLNADVSEGFRGTLAKYAKETGISLDEAVERLASGQAPQNVREHLQSIRSQAIIEDEVIRASKLMKEAEARLADSVKDAARDTELMARNFPDKFDIAKAQEEMNAAVERIIDRMPDPVGEEEGKKKLRERMKDFAEAVRASFEAIVNRVLGAVGASPKA